MTKSNNKMSTKTIALGAVMTAMVILLQLLGTYTAFFGPFSAALALIPIIIGAAMCGVAVGAWLGLVFSLVVVFTGGANLFLTFNILGTYITVLTKGILCGVASGIAYKLLKKYNDVVATVVASLICPVVNTGIFLLGSAVFFLDKADAIAAELESTITGMSLFVGIATGNFLFEIGFCIVLSPVVIRLLKIAKKEK